MTNTQEAGGGISIGIGVIILHGPSRQRKFCVTNLAKEDRRGVVALL
jgi:hypothetical protein